MDQNSGFILDGVYTKKQIKKIKYFYYLFPPFEVRIFNFFHLCFT